MIYRVFLKNWCFLTLLACGVVFCIFNRYMMCFWRLAVSSTCMYSERLLLCLYIHGWNHYKTTSCVWLWFLRWTCIFCASQLFKLVEYFCVAFFFYWFVKYLHWKVIFVFCTFIRRSLKKTYILTFCISSCIQHLAYLRWILVVLHK